MILEFAHKFQKSLTGLTQSSILRIDEENRSLDKYLFYPHLTKGSLSDFLTYTHPRQKSHTFIALHETPNSFNGGHLNLHIKGNSMLSKNLQNGTPIRGDHIMRYEGFAF